MTGERPAIRLTGLTKTFGAVNAVDHLDLDIAEGEFFSMLGPSSRMPRSASSPCSTT